MVIGLTDVPPVSSPIMAYHESDKEFLLDAMNVMRPGLVGSIPA